MELQECKNIEELVNEVYNQILDSSFFMENYALLQSVKDYLEKSVDNITHVNSWEELTEEEIKEEIFNYFEYDYHGTLLSNEND